MRKIWRALFVGAFLCLVEFGISATAPVVASDNAGRDVMPICTLPKCLNPRVTVKSGIGTANATTEAKVHPEDAAKWCATYKPKDKLCVSEQVRSGWVGFRGLYRASADCVAGRMTAIDGNQYTYAGVWEDGPGKGRPKFTTTNRQFPHTKWDETGIATHPDGTITGWGGGSPNLAAQWEVLCAGASAPAIAAASAPPQPVAQVPNAIQVRSSELQQFATETPLVSADFGTPAATAKIAAKAGFIDVVGVKLGTPLKSAIEALKEHNVNLTIEPQTMAPYEALPGVVMTPLLTSKKNTNTASNQEKEYVGLLVTFAPNEPFVWGMWRELWYEKEENRPTIETIVAGLRSKYGQESLKDVGTRLIWMFDAQGQPMKEAQTRDIMNKCRWKIEGNNLLVTYYNREVVGGHYHTSYGKDHFNGLCQSYAIVEAQYMAQTPLGKASPPLVSTVRVNASNHQLEVSGVTASHTLLMHEATKLAEGRKGEAAKREIPKF